MATLFAQALSQAIPSGLLGRRSGRNWLQLLGFLSRLQSMPIGGKCPFTECADELRKARNVLMRLLIHPAQRRIRAECEGDETPA
jgi:hypothetical protein